MDHKKGKVDPPQSGGKRSHKTCDKNDEVGRKEFKRKQSRDSQDNKSKKASASKSESDRQSSKCDKSYTSSRKADSYSMGKLKRNVCATTSKPAIKQQVTGIGNSECSTILSGINTSKNKCNTKRVSINKNEIDARSVVQDAIRKHKKALETPSEVGCVEILEEQETNIKRAKKDAIVAKNNKTVHTKKKTKRKLNKQTVAKRTDDASVEKDKKNVKIKRSHSTCVRIETSLFDKKVKLSDKENTGRKKTSVLQQSSCSTSKQPIVDESDVTSILLHMEGPTDTARADDSTSGADANSESESDWEDVADVPQTVTSQIPSKSVEVILEPPTLFNEKRKKKKFDWRSYIRQQMNKFKKGVRTDMHKAHLMCLLAHGRFVNQVCNTCDLHGQALSVLPHKFLDIPLKDFNMIALEKFLKWFSEAFLIRRVLRSKGSRSLLSILSKSFEIQQVASVRELTLVFLILLRVIRLEVRLLMSLQPVPLKADEQEESLYDCSNETNQVSKSSKSQSKSKDKSRKYSEQMVEQSTSSRNGKPRLVPKPKNLRPRNCASKVGSSRKEKRKASEKSSKLEDSSGSDFESDAFKKKLSPVTAESEDDASAESLAAVDQWCEVYLLSSRKWIPVDCQRRIINKPRSLEKRATPTVHYVLAYEANGAVKDVTPRYASQWLSTTRKLRVDQDWWDITLLPHKSPNSIRDSMETDEIKASLLSKPIPKTVCDFKGHPLYVLRRHLLKFEAIYPDSAVPLGFVRGEPIYARECVHVLHSRENWIKEGRAVRIGEVPYKMVKSRPKWNKPKENPDSLDLPTFGKWQTEIYIPMPAANGKVPRNEYGNVELFQASMLPAGTVHLRGYPNLNKVARRLDIDCAPAMVGWENRWAFSHPLMDGFIVCEEFRDILVAACNEDEKIQKQKMEEKRQKRVYGNWKLLIKGLLIKERVKKRFNLKTTAEPKATKSTDQTMATDVGMSWPRNVQASTSNRSHCQDEVEEM